MEGSSVADQVSLQGSAVPCRQISLSLTPRYAQTWSSWEGVRELVQNWHDGIYEGAETLNLVPKGEINFVEKEPRYYYEAVLSQPSPHPPVPLGSLRYDSIQSRLTLVNRHTALHRRVLLLGYSEKAVRREVIGQFGEGLKVGTLALVREGRSVTLETGQEHWLFELVQDPNFGEKVLTVLVTDRPQSQSSTTSIQDESPMAINGEDTRTTVSLEPELWESYRGRFLFLSPPQDLVRTAAGSLLLDPALAGQMYVKGVWVADMTTEDLRAGVDFTQLQLDRDRQAVPKPSQIDQLVSCIWVRALQSRPQLVSHYYNLLAGNTPYRDVRHVLTYADDDVAKMIADQFTLTHGSSAFAVGSDITRQQLQAVSRELQKEVVICNQTLLSLLHASGRHQTLDHALSAIRCSQKARHHPSTWSESERAALEGAVRLAQFSDSTIQLTEIDVVTKQEVEACYLEDGRVQVPDCWLRTDGAHHNGQLCKDDDGPCHCREVRLCLMLLTLRQDAACGSLGVDGRPSAAHHPLLAVMHALITQTNMKKPVAPAQEQPDRESVNIHKHCAEREQQLFALIEQLKESHQESLQHQQTETRQLLVRFRSLEKEVVGREVQLVDAENRVRESYEQRLGAVRQELGDQTCRLQQEVDFLKAKLEDVNAKVRSEKEVQSRREEALLDELLHYTDQCLNRSESLRELGARSKDGANGEDGNNQPDRLTEIADLLSENLQRQRFVCAVCLRKKKEVLLSPCHHYTLCEGCTQQVQASSHPWCPTCKTPIASYMRVYE